MISLDANRLRVIRDSRIGSTETLQINQTEVRYDISQWLKLEWFCTTVRAMWIISDPAFTYYQLCFAERFAPGLELTIIS